MKKYMFLLLGLFACELSVDVDVPFEKKQLTLNCLFTPDTTLLVGLNLNRHILSDSNFKSIDDADVVVLRNGIVMSKLIVKDQQYISEKWRPSIGETYEIVATTNAYGSVSSQSFIPAPEKITHVEMIEGLVGQHGEPDNTLRVTFTDSSPAANYYQLTVSTWEESYNFESKKIRRSGYIIPLESNDPVVQEAIIGHYEGVLIKDILFNGKETTISVKTSDPSLFHVPNNFIVTLRTVSEDYYRYKSTFSLQWETSDDPFAQPVTVYNNIQNGFGIFAGFSQDYYPLEQLPRFEITSISPTSGKPGDHVIITGKRFPISEYISPIVFNGTQHNFDDRAVVARATDTEIEVIVPEKAETGKIVFDYNQRIAVSEVDFEILQ